LDFLPTIIDRSSKYPPAKLGALRLLAPRRGLIAIGKKENLSPKDHSDIGFFSAATNAL